MNIPSFDDVQAPNIRAANEHLRRQVDRIPALLRQIAVLEAELQDARTLLDASARELAARSPLVYDYAAVRTVA
ncbi:hypothetical protein [Jiangella endophytica]|uniref:hypothetical protein n=1 Tax=Jiangella endophytica TaxID=1623398 RepID=UPI000E346C7B|nr:hypothetical protein [Jiangella endophytica]